MQCSCGGMVTGSNHEILTDSKASEWARVAVEAPVTVIQNRCEACGRMQVLIMKNGIQIAKRG